MNETRSQVVLLVVGGLLTLLLAWVSWSVITIYDAGDDSRQILNEHAKKGVELSGPLASAAAVVETTKDVLPQSADRLSAVEKLDTSREGNRIDRARADSWHRLAADARRQALDDRSSLDRIPGELEASAQIKASLETLLDREIACWKALEAYVEFRATTPKDFGELLFNDYRESLEQYQSALASHPSLLIAFAGQNATDTMSHWSGATEAALAAMARERRNLNAAVAGVVVFLITGVGIVWYLAHPYYAKSTSTADSNAVRVENAGKKAPPTSAPMMAKALNEQRGKKRRKRNAK